jgi:hypothetical protein
MTNVTLMGAEEVQRAGIAMRQAAEEMRQAANRIEDSLHRQRLFMDDWIERFIQAIVESKHQ